MADTTFITRGLTPEEERRAFADLLCHVRNNHEQDVPQYGDYLWLCKGGDNYFAFGDDAKEIASACGMALQKTNCGIREKYVCIPCGDKLEEMLDFLLEGQKGILLCRYEAPMCEPGNFRCLPILPGAKQITLF